MSDSFARILVVTRNLPPLVGGMERLNLHLVKVLAGSSQVAVVGPQGSRRNLPPHTYVREVALKPLWRFLLCALLEAIRAALRKRVELVVSGSGLTAPIGWIAAKCIRARSAVYVHGLDLVINNWLYRTLWLPFIRRSDLVFANSANTARLAVAARIPAERVVVLHPGTILPTPCNDGRANFRSRYLLGERPVLLSVGRLTQRKGLVEFIEYAMPRILEAEPEARLAVIGSEAVDALSGANSYQRERLEQAAQRANVSRAVMFLPACNDEDLAQAYEAADVHVFPVISVPGDVEGFGMVAVEAAAHGLPTVGFAVGGVPDAVVEGVTGNLVRANDYPALASQVVKWLSKRKQIEVRRRCAYAARVYGWDRFDLELSEHLKRLAVNR